MLPYQENEFQRLDWRIFDLIHNQWSPDWLNPVMKMITDTGLGHIKLIFLLPFMIWRKTRYVGIACFFAGAISGILNLIFKEVFGRWRPGRFPELTTPLDVGILAPSYPSGHTTTSFGIAFMCVFLLARTRHAWVAWLVILWAALVGYSRIYVGVHWLSDVLAGVAFGAFGAAAAAWIYQRLGRWPESNEPLIPEKNSPGPGSDTPPDAAS
jgi:undecaprenyl-diphosphatase